MKGLFIHKGCKKKIENVTEYELLGKSKTGQVMMHRYQENYKIYIAPPKDKETIEFLHIIKGKMGFYDGQEYVVLKDGDSICSLGLEDHIIIDIMEDSKVLYFTTEQVYEEITEMLDKINIVIDQIDQKDHYTKGHSERVAQYAAAIVQQCSHAIDKIENIIYASQLHDVGKCKVPDEILLKPGRFTPEERAVMNQHAANTYQLLTEEFGIAEEISKIAACHHERYDGTGYPYGLKGEDIPFEARVIALADTFDAITTSRSYQVARTKSEAIEEIEKFAHQYDPKLFEILKELVTTGKV